MNTRLSLAALVLSCVAIAIAYLLAFLPGGAPPWAAWGLVLGSAGALSSVTALGASRDGRLRPVALIACASVFVVIAGAFGAALLMPPNEGAHARLLLGLPVRTAIVLYGIGCIPLVILPLAYALTFDVDTLSAADLERIRAAARERRP